MKPSPIRSEAPVAFAHSGFFALRSPLLPFDVLASSPPLKALLEDPGVREAIFVASPSLDAQLDASHAAAVGNGSSAKVEQALLRYVTRMAGRATPFGLFAGCSVGTVARGTCLTVGKPSGRHTRLDMDYVVLLADALAADPALRPALRFFPNSSLYRVGARARYHEVRRKDHGWTHHRATLGVPDYLEVVLARAAGGATPAELARALVAHDPEAAEDEAAEYVAELIAQQVLVSELAPAVTGEEPVHGLIDRLRAIPQASAIAESLSRVRDGLAAMDAGGVGADPARYRAVAAELGSLPAGADLSRLFQVDLVRNGSPTLGDNVIAEIARGVELLRRITPRPPEDSLAAFRRAFLARFGDSIATREVPLAEALDEETGVGFAEGAANVEASSLLEGLDVCPATSRSVSWGPREAHLLRLLTETLARGDRELRLSERDVDALAAGDPPPLPDAFAAMARVEAADGAAVARGEFRLFLGGAGGPSGARLLGRFCHADPELAAAVAGHLRAEEALRPDAIFAEVVHLPEGRVGNILSRPVCRDWEIPYLGRSGAPADRQIPLSDLRVSVQKDRVVLRSARLGREVVPRLTSAHNFGAGQGVYSFLCALQGQGVASALGWEWGPFLASAFLPRVTAGRLVLARAQWRVTREEAARLSAPGDADRLRLVGRWRDERGLPRWVCLAESDNELPIDLENPAMVAMLLGRLRAHDATFLIELFPDPARLCASGDDGGYTHEIVVPFVRKPEPAAAGGTVRAVREHAPATCRRVFVPGSEWLSLKLYAGSLVVDHLVRDVLGPLSEELVAEGAAKLWFFVRYADPHGHLRIRFAGDPARLWQDVLDRVRSAVAPLVADGRVWKLQIDTYEREIERYGGPEGIEHCERLFHADSRAAVEMLALDHDDPKGDRRWRATLLGMDGILGDLGLDLETRVALLGHIREAGRLQFHANGARLAKVGAKWREEAPKIAGLLAVDGDASWDAERAVCERRSLRGAPAASALSRLAAGGRLTAFLPDVAASLLHMHCNRMLRSGHRLQELVLHELLHRHHAGMLARSPAAAAACAAGGER